MAKRSVRATRHRHDAAQHLTFKQLVHIGMVHAKLVRKEITYNDIPQWIRDVSKSKKQEAELNTVVQTEIDSVITAEEQVAEEVQLSLDDVIDHVHGESCNH